MKKLYFFSNFYECPNVSNFKILADTVFYLNHCFFSFLFNPNSYGGILYCVNAIIKMNLTNSIFLDCGCNGRGGGIYFSSSSLGTDSILNKICSYHCFTTSGNYHQFAYIVTSTYGKNYIDMCSITKCNNITTTYFTIHIDYAHVSFKNNNISKNYNLGHSGPLFHMPTTMDGRYCNIAYNNNSDVCTLYFYGNTNNMSYTNVINNLSPGGGVVIVWNSGIYLLENFIFLNNYRVLFSVLSGGQLTIFNSQIFHQFETNIGSLSFSLISNISNIIFHFDQFTSHLCQNNIHSQFQFSFKFELIFSFNLFFKYFFFIIIN